MAKKRAVQAPSPVPQASVWPERAVTFLSRHSLAMFLVLVVVASARIVTTYTVFNHTVDEPAHIACGMEWLDQAGPIIMKRSIRRCRG